MQSKQGGHNGELSLSLNFAWMVLFCHQRVCLPSLFPFTDWTFSVTAFGSSPLPGNASRTTWLWECVKDSKWRVYFTSVQMYKQLKSCHLTSPEGPSARSWVRTEGKHLPCREELKLLLQVWSHLVSWGQDLNTEAFLCPVHLPFPCLLSFITKEECSKQTSVPFCFLFSQSSQKQLIGTNSVELILGVMSQLGKVMTLSMQLIILGWMKFVCVLKLIEVGVEGKLMTLYLISHISHHKHNVKYDTVSRRRLFSFCRLLEKWPPQ